MAQADSGAPWSARDVLDRRGPGRAAENVLHADQYTLQWHRIIPHNSTVHGTCLVPGGAPTFHRGLSALMKVDGHERQ